MGGSTASPSRMLALWCPDWPVVAALRESGLPSDTPAVVLTAARVLVVSASARTYGIRIGMRRREAQSRCPEVVVLRDDPDRDARLFEVVAAAVEELVPAIEVLRPGLVACPVRGPARYFGSENNAAERLVDVVEALDMECRIGIAEGLSTAVLAARQSTIVEPGGDAAFCARLPIAELAREPVLAPSQWKELIGLLQRLGITTAGALAELPLEKIAARFGESGVALHRLATGRADRGLSRRGIAGELFEEQNCDPPLERIDTAAFVAKALAERFHAKLAVAGFACTRLAITATTVTGDEFSRIWRCTRPLTAAGTADRLRWQLDGWLTELSRTRLARTEFARRSARRPLLPPGEIDETEIGGAAITVLRLEAIEALDAGRIQYGLWGPDGAGEHRAGAAFARVQGLLGVESVRSVMRSGGRGPVDRVSLAPWGELVQPNRDPNGPWPGALPAPAPTQTSVPAPAQAAASRAPVGSRVEVYDQDGYRIDLTDRGMLSARPNVLDGRRVVSWAGPWLLQERWWTGSTAAIPEQRRARMQVVTEPGPPMLLEFGADGWLIEAVYD